MVYLILLVAILAIVLGMADYLRLAIICCLIVLLYSVFTHDVVNIIIWIITLLTMSYYYNNKR